MKYGFITGLVMIVIGAILYLTGVAFKPGMQYVTYIPFLIGLILNAQDFTKANDGFVTYGNVFSSCFKATAIITLLLLVWSLLSIALFPHMKEEAMEMARQQMSKNPQMTDDQIEMAMNMTKKYWNVFLVGGVVFGTLFVGAILSLIAAAIPKKKGAAPMQNM
jgi:hypothetical protein